MQLREALVEMSSRVNGLSPEVLAVVSSLIIEFYLSNLMMWRTLLPALLVAGSVASADAARCSFGAGGTIDVSDGDGSFEVSFPPGSPSVPFAGGEVAVRTDGRWYSRDAGTLRLKMGPAVSDGVDTLGAYDSL